MAFRCRLVCTACIGGALMLLYGCAASPPAPAKSSGTANADSAALNNPDPSVRLALRSSPMLIDNPSLLGQPGLVRVYDIRGTSNHISLFFVARSDAAEFKDLSSYSTWADDMLKQRDIRPIEIRADRNPVRDARFPFVARSYVNVQRPGQPAPTAICDAAGLRFETPGGYWTISWNSDLGKIDESMPALEELLRVMDITRTTAAAQAAPTITVLGPGVPAPHLEIKEWIRGAPLDALANDQTYVVEFWATWCGPCIENIPHLSALARQHDKVRFIGVSIFEDNDKKQVQEFVAKMGDKMSYTVGYSGNKDAMAASWMAAAKQGGIPTAFVVKDGVVMWIGHPTNLGTVLNQLEHNEFDLAASRKAFDAGLAARDARAREREQLEECARRFDAGDRTAAKEALARVEQSASAKAGAEELRYRWLCIEDPATWRLRAVDAMDKSQEHGSELSMFAVENSERAPAQCKWLIEQLTTRFPDNWYPWLCGARMSNRLKEYDAALRFAQKSREAILEFQRQNPDAPRGNALDVIKALEDEIRAASAR